jgi:hypothetical protein
MVGVVVVGGVGVGVGVGVTVGGASTPGVPLPPHPLMAVASNATETAIRERRRTFFMEIAPFLNCSSMRRSV